MVKKQVLILDNLGLSALRIRDRFKEMGDFTEAVISVVSDEIENMGEIGENVGIKVDQMRASFTNFKIALGDLVVSDEAEGIIVFFDDLILKATEFIESFSDDNITKFTKQIKKITTTAKGGKGTTRRGTF